MIVNIHTLILILGITNLLQVIVLTQQYKVNKTYNGVGWWLLWCIAETIGFGVVLLRAFPVIENLAILLQNIFIILGVVFMYIGVLKFLDQNRKMWIIISLYSIYILSILFFLFIKNSIVIRGYFINSFLAIIFYVTAVELFTHKKRQFASSANFMTVVFVLEGLFFTYRTIMLALGLPVSDFFASTFLNSITYINGIVISLTMAFGFIVMLNQRLNFDAIESKAYFETIFNMSPNGTIITRLDNNIILNVNHGFTELTGYSIEESIGKTSLELSIWENPDERKKIFFEVITNDSCKNIEATFIQKNGNKVIGLVSSRKVVLHNIPLIISVIQDITDRKKSEEELHQLKDNLAAEVEAKTKELKDRIIELERFHNATINREMRVKELRDEIKKLKGEDKPLD